MRRSAAPRRSALTTKAPERLAEVPPRIGRPSCSARLPTPQEREGPRGVCLKFGPCARPRSRSTAPPRPSTRPSPAFSKQSSTPSNSRGLTRQANEPSRVVVRARVDRRAGLRREDPAFLGPELPGRRPLGVLLGPMLLQERDQLVRQADRPASRLGLGVVRLRSGLLSLRAVPGPLASAAAVASVLPCRPRPRTADHQGAGLEVDVDPLQAEKGLNSPRPTYASCRTENDT